MLTHGELTFCIGDAVEMMSSSKQSSTEGDYKVLESIKYYADHALGQLDCGD